jgi:hypothetical protein
MTQPWWDKYEASPSGHQEYQTNSEIPPNVPTYMTRFHSWWMTQRRDNPSQIWLIGWLSAIWLSIPTNLFWHTTISQAYVDGILIDYLLPKISLSDCLMIGFLVSWGWVYRQSLSFDEVKSFFVNNAAANEICA